MTTPARRHRTVTLRNRVVVVQTHDQYVKLMELATSRRGWWDPAVPRGEVTFTNATAAYVAARDLV